MIEGFEFKDNYGIEDLIGIVAILRSPGGCPWDIEQDHKSIKRDFIEETYEVIEAINKDDKELLREELGDVLLQVVFHTRIEEEKNVFDFDDICDGICKKLIIRHPHVFGDVTVNGTDDVLSNWDDIKRFTKNQKTTTEAMDAVPRELPALMRAEKIQKKAKKAGFDWNDVSGAFAKIHEETAELETAVANDDRENIEEELGDLLFAAVNVSRFVKVDAEEALTKATDKFFARFASVEKLAAERNIDMKNSSLEELDSLWDEVKNK